MSITVCVAGKTLQLLKAGGHLWYHLNWVLGLRTLGCQVIWLEQVHAKATVSEIEARDCAVLLFEGNADGKVDVQPLEHCESFGRSRAGVADIARSADLLLNFSCFLRPPLLSMLSAARWWTSTPGTFRSRP